MTTKIPFDDFVRRHLAAEDMVRAALAGDPSAQITAMTDDFELGMFMSALVNVAGRAVQDSADARGKAPSRQLRDLVGGVLQLYARRNPG